MLGPPLPHEIVRDTATALVLSDGARSQRDSTCGDDTAAAPQSRFLRERREALERNPHARCRPRRGVRVGGVL